MALERFVTKLGVHVFKGCAVVIDSLETWNDAAFEALEELVESVLGWEIFSKGEARLEAPPKEPGAFITLISDQNAVQVGITASINGCGSIARALMCSEEDETLSTSDMIDALGELVNILAGSMKTKMSDKDSHLQLGLPVFVDGFVEGSPNVESLVTPIRAGEINGHAVLLRRRQAA